MHDNEGEYSSGGGVISIVRARAAGGGGEGRSGRGAPGGKRTGQEGFGGGDQGGEREAGQGEEEGRAGGGDGDGDDQALSALARRAVSFWLCTCLCHSVILEPHPAPGRPPAYQVRCRTTGGSQGCNWCTERVRRGRVHYQNWPMAHVPAVDLGAGCRLHPRGLTNSPNRPSCLQGPSPDEVALLDAARQVGWELAARRRDTLELRVAEPVRQDVRQDARQGLDEVQGNGIGTQAAGLRGEEPRARGPAAAEEGVGGAAGVASAAAGKAGKAAGQRGGSGAQGAPAVGSASGGPAPGPGPAPTSAPAASSIAAAVSTSSSSTYAPTAAAAAVTVRYRVLNVLEFSSARKWVRDNCVVKHGGFASVGTL